jgi:hypothetical protein
VSDQTMMAALFMLGLALVMFVIVTLIRERP